MVDIKKTKSSASATRQRFTKSALLILTSYFLLDRREISGGIGEHYVGLYGTFIKNLAGVYKIFWYSINDSTLRVFNTNGKLSNLNKTLMPLAILKVLVEARRTSESTPSFTTIMAYYYAAKKPLSFLLSLLILDFLKITGLTNVIVDIIDPPVEVHVTYTDSPSFGKVFWGTMLDILTLKRGTLMWFCSNSYWKYLTKKYGINSERTYVIYDGSVPELITPRPPKAEGPLTIFYSGSLMNAKGIPQLINSVNRLRKRGLDVNLLLTGGNVDVEIEEKPWIRSMLVNDWLEWIKLLSEEADICVIPYPRRVHWDITFHMKIPDYMAASKPIVAMYGVETAYFLQKNKCGVTARNWEEFEEKIIRLHEDRQLARALGENGRRAVEDFYNYKNFAEVLNEIIQSHLKASRA